MSATLEEHVDLEVRPVAGHIGADIRGVDLSQPLSHEVIAAIRAAWLQWKVVFFRDQHITPAQQVAFGRYFGEARTEHYTTRPALPDHPEVLPLDTIVEERPDPAAGFDSPPSYSEDGDAGWHSDASFALKPPMASALRGLVVPDRGGDTLFANIAVAYETLSKPMRQFLEGLRAVHHNPAHQRYEGVAAIRSVHPVVRVHPETGEKTLYVNPMYTSHIVGLTPQESRQILTMLYQHLARPEFTVRFRWEPGSIAFWDNRSACHRAPGDVPVGTRRTMHRITLSGDVPVGPDGFRSQPLTGEASE